MCPNLTNVLLFILEIYILSLYIQEISRYCRYYKVIPHSSYSGARELFSYHYTQWVPLRDIAPYYTGLIILKVTVFWKKLTGFNCMLYGHVSTTN